MRTHGPLLVALAVFALLTPACHHLRRLLQTAPDNLDAELQKAVFHLPPEDSTAAGAGADGGSAADGEGGAADGGAGPGPLAWLAAQCEGFSGSDLVQLCSQAAAVPIQEQIE